MCVVSNVTDKFQRDWGNPWDVPKQPTVPLHPLRIISEADWQEYQRLKRNAMEIDKITNQPDCIKPALDEWEKKMEAFLKKKGILK